MLKIGINGFGRIGRLVFRIAMQREDIQVVAVNDPFVTPDYMAYMLKYDSVHGRFEGSIEYTDNSLIVDGVEVKCFEERDPASIPWGDTGVEVVAEATGVFKELDTAQAHIDAGAQKVIITAPSKTGAECFARLELTALQSELADLSEYVLCLTNQHLCLLWE